ncbi:hypothetical protein CSUI_010238 [Cystoisospora suis]|uniref:Transmembrane protein n=1 Tax=Cystoisospora suis TaxID=483139 RepID=A0A2C6KH21_9APIC|nr:hypothetical protein CSUI_010238 [Cystoisospora suis]
MQNEYFWKIAAALFLLLLLRSVRRVSGEPNSKDLERSSRDSTAAAGFPQKDRATIFASAVQTPPIYDGRPLQEDGERSNSSLNGSGRRPVALLTRHNRFSSLTNLFRTQHGMRLNLFPASVVGAVLSLFLWLYASVSQRCLKSRSGGSPKSKEDDCTGKLFELDGKHSEPNGSGDVVGGQSGTTGLFKTHQDRLSFVPLLIFAVLLILVTSALAAPSGGREKGRRQLGHRSPGTRRKRGPFADWVNGELPLERLPREEVMDLREMAGVYRGDGPVPPVDYERASDGVHLNIVVGRAWKDPEGGWKDGVSSARFQYRGHTFHVFLPRDIERVLEEEGLLSEFIMDLSVTPRSPALEPMEKSDGADDLSTTADEGQIGEFHWGRQVTTPSIHYVWTHKKIRYIFHPPESYLNLVSLHPPERTRIDAVFQRLVDLFMKLHHDGLDRVRLLERKGKIEL